MNIGITTIYFVEYLLFSLLSKVEFIFYIRFSYFSFAA